MPPATRLRQFVGDRRHGVAVATLVVCALLWSLAGIVVRRLDSAAGLEVTFMRSASCAIFLGALMTVLHGRRWLTRTVAIGWAGVASTVMWAIMFTCFSIALTMTTVAKALVLNALSPLLAALLAWLCLRESIALRTWLAIGLGGVGIAVMVADGLTSNDGLPNSVLGMFIAAAVPVAGAINLILLRRSAGTVDLIPAVMLGACLSALAVLPFAFPMQASTADMGWLALLGVFQVGIPCSLMVLAARYLAPQEIALLALLEVVLGPLWVWLGVGERPAEATLWGGALVLIALVGNEMGSMRRRRLPGLPRLPGTPMPPAV